MSPHPPPPTDPALLELRQLVRPNVWAARVAAANTEAVLLGHALDAVRSGATRKAALAEHCPDRPHRTMLKRLRIFEAGGRDALIDRRVPNNSLKMTDEVRAAVGVLARAHPELGSVELAKLVTSATGVEIADSTLRFELAAMGLARPRGRPRGSRSSGGAEVDGTEVEVVPLAYAGAELLKAVDMDVGAVAGLTEAMSRQLQVLPAPEEGAVLDDTAHRDERGRFTGAYNAAKSRTTPEQGGKFDTVERRRSEKDLRKMRVAENSFETLFRKNLCLTLLPIVVETARWSSLASWQGKHLETLVGHAYMPATLDKHARELKLAGVANALREETTSFWMEREDFDSGFIAYIDAATKPIWTHAFTRCAKVSSTGRVMPAMSTVWLHSGSGTPLLYRTFSGHVSVPREAVKFLGDVEKAAGEGNASRLVVLDRESHAVWMFKELNLMGWSFVVPLRKSVTRKNAQLRHGEWSPYGDDGDEVCDGTIVLNDSRRGEPALETRVVGRRRHRSGKVAWFATNTEPDLFDAATLVRHYFDRWPLQEHVFRTGNGRVGLDVPHGYGKKKVTNVAVVNRLETLAALIKRSNDMLEQTRTAMAAVAPALADWESASSEFRAGCDEVVAALDVSVAAEDTSSFRELLDEVRRFERWLGEAAAARHGLEAEREQHQQRIEKLRARIARYEAERARLQGRTEIFTVDTELDEIMTAFKLTFMNLANCLMRDHLKDRMELDTLVRSVLTLPGQLELREDRATVCIYRQPRDPRAMASVERACASLTALGLRRGDRRLDFRLVDQPAPGQPRIS